VAKFDTGFWIGGFGLGESVEERCNLLNAVTVRTDFFVYKLLVHGLLCTALMALATCRIIL
jgi:hypothetical protein